MQKESKIEKKDKKEIKCIDKTKKKNENKKERKEETKMKRKRKKKKREKRCIIIIIKKKKNVLSVNKTLKHLKLNTFIRIT